MQPNHKADSGDSSFRDLDIESVDPTLANADDPQQQRSASCAQCLAAFGVAFVLLMAFHLVRPSVPGSLREMVDARRAELAPKTTSVNNYDDRIVKIPTGEITGAEANWIRRNPVRNYKAEIERMKREVTPVRVDEDPLLGEFVWCWSLAIINWLGWAAWCLGALICVTPENRAPAIN